MNPFVSQSAYAVFHNGLIKIPPMTLRAGNAVDSYELPPPYDEQLDEPTDDYLQQFAYFALPYLDALSWHYYLPFLIDYSLRHGTAEAAPESCLPVEGTLSSLRPPEREPPRLSVLTPEQKSVIVDFLEVMAFDERSNYQDYAMQVLEEYWIPGALYRDEK
jgi:hypothetical protein